MEVAPLERKRQRVRRVQPDSRTQPRPGCVLLEREEDPALGHPSGGAAPKVGVVRSELEVRRVQRGAGPGSTVDAAIPPAWELERDSVRREPHTTTATTASAASPSCAARPAARTGRSRTPIRSWKAISRMGVTTLAPASTVAPRSAPAAAPISKPVQGCAEASAANHT